MDGPQGHYAKWNKSARERQMPYDLSYRWNRNKNLYKQRKKPHKLIDTENRLVVARGGRGVGERGEEGQKVKIKRNGQRTWTYIL